MKMTISYLRVRTDVVLKFIEVRRKLLASQRKYYYCCFFIQPFIVNALVI